MQSTNSEYGSPYLAVCHVTSHQKDYSMHFTIYATGAEVGWSSFVVLTTPNHTLVGGVCVNTLCQQAATFIKQQYIFYIVSCFQH